MHDGNIDTFLKHLTGVGAETPATNIHHVAGIGKKGNNTTFVIGGRHHGHIMQVTGRLPWIVSDKNIAWLHNLDRVTGQEMNDSFRHCVDMAWRPGDCLSQHSPLRIKHRCCQVSSFSNAG